jgi:hypothetical protein
MEKAQKNKGLKNKDFSNLSIPSSLKTLTRIKIKALNIVLSFQKILKTV